MGANRHGWETRFAQIDEDAGSAPVEALADLTALVEEMLAAAGYRTHVPDGAGGEPEVVAALGRARELVAADEAGEGGAPTTTLSRPRPSCASSTTGCSSIPEADARADLPRSARRCDGRPAGEPASRPLAAQAQRWPA